MTHNSRAFIKILNRQDKRQIGRRERDLITRAANEAIAAGADGRMQAILPQKEKSDRNTRINRKYIRTATGDTELRKFKAKRYKRLGNVNRRLNTEIAVTLTDDAVIRVTNGAYRGTDGATDVLSFPLVDFTTERGFAADAIPDWQTGRVQLGEIVISAERAVAQADEYGHSFERELAFLTIHGVLHLLGYDHIKKGETKMKELAGLALSRTLELAAPADATSPNEYRSGFVAVLGKPNVGKSTLINAMCGNSIAIVSDKPQTTRRNSRHIVTTDAYQIIFIDTPGAHNPRNRLGEQMMRGVRASLEGADAALLIVDARDGSLRPEDTDTLTAAKKSKLPVLLVINKCDLVPKDKLLPFIDRVSREHEFFGIVPITALKPRDGELALAEAVKMLPAGGRLYPDDMITDQSERRICEDIIRQKALTLLNMEIPHGVDVEIEKFRKREKDGLYEIEATLYCERESHKKIIIGRNGEMLKRIGTMSRIEIERFISGKAYLNVWVKVLKDWRNDEGMLKRMGYFPNKG